MKIIFLDIDGVLNNHSEPDKEISKRNIHNLNEIIKATEAKVVISSCWRFSFTKESLQNFLNSFGFIGEIIDFTVAPQRFEVRGNVIRAWIIQNEELLGENNNNFNDFVIIDDEGDMLLWQANNFVQTDRFAGLSIQSAWKAIKILNGRFPENITLFDV